MRVSRSGTIALSVDVPLPPGGKAHPLAAPFVSYCLVRAETDDGLVGLGRDQRRLALRVRHRRGGDRG